MAVIEVCKGIALILLIISNKLYIENRLVLYKLAKILKFLLLDINIKPSLIVIYLISIRAPITWANN